MRALFLNQRTAANNDVTTGLVNLQDFALNDTADIVTDVGRTADIDLACRQEYVYSDIDEQTTLDLASDRAGDDLAFLDVLHHGFPRQDLLSFLLADHDHAVGIFGYAEFVFEVLDQYLEGLPDFRIVLILFPFPTSDASFALEANIDEYGIVIDSNDSPFDDGIDFVTVLWIQRFKERFAMFGVANFCFEQRTEIGIIF